MRKPLWCVLVGLGLACGAGASGPPSWEKAEATRDEEEGWSREVGGLRLQLAQAVRHPDGSLSFTIYAHATPAALRRLGAGERISLHLSDARGLETTMAGPVPLNMAGWVGGKVRHGWGWSGAPASMTFAHVEWTGRGLATRKFRIRPAPR